MNIDIFLDAAKQASISAGKYLKENFGKPQKLLNDSGRDIKLAIDSYVEESIKNDLNKFDFGFLGEETGGRIENFNGFFWVVDPLDGTSNYYRNIPTCANSIALMDNDLNVHLAVINNFLEGKLYQASLGGGAYCNNYPISVSDISSKSKATLMTGIPTKQEYYDQEFQTMIQSFQTWKKIRMIGSAAIAGTWVAEGLADCYLEQGIFIWDVAATKLLVEEAGGMSSITNPTQDHRVDACFSNGNL